MSAPVFFAEPADVAAHAAGSRYVLDGPEGRHAGVVQRRSPGERIDVADGAGTRLRCTVAEVDGARVLLDVDEVVAEPEPDVVVTLVQALAKGDRDELAIEAATEVGADAILPWQAERSIVVWRGDRAEKSRARWVSTVRAATKQARRARVPEVGGVVATRALAARVRDVVAAGGAAVVLHEEATTALADVVLPEPAAAGRGPELLVVVGPEGGIGAGEVDALREAGASLARLGPHVLRTSTAGPVAIALISERLGRWAGV
ncbi:16S rRNA (uracil1498-N3)-methyltransferase [Sediminihabitans luteus]|uniref:Ribosomal RNA small subunit methyltransferase E n=1 Tax=Sediminihabitans luteus TaxID=1138585 RepID=A0A2M9CPU8_9CELL|nr:16S rRNA (uracil(1498)-N(3))-methyltransferase [Sediminihabitans luteus]PJJ73930.1 16S rRNA (uracil1498-N3)-methyltransferase [Sediminihabitans luteus]GII98157.1 ribosomal RNA small subunit methyltransferase E [Sediminihabitans luteus]